jgi:hypothetical protein
MTLHKFEEFNNSSHRNGHAVGILPIRNIQLPRHHPFPSHVKRKVHIPHGP